jgi:hypothetical protein
MTLIARAKKIVQALRDNGYIIVDARERDLMTSHDDAVILATIVNNLTEDNA